MSKFILSNSSKPLYWIPKCLHMQIRTKYYKNWTVPFKLNDEQNLIGHQADIREQWLSEVDQENKDDHNTVDISRLPQRLKSRMNKHKNFVRIQSKEETSIAYQRKVFGHFGNLSGIDPSICWPSKKEIMLQTEREKTFEVPIENMVEQLNRKKERWNAFIEKRMESLDANLEKMPHSIEQYNKRQAKQNEAMKALEKKRQERIDEARDFFGYVVEPSDPKFIRRKEALEEEEKRKKKMEKKKKKASRLGM